MIDALEIMADEYRIRGRENVQVVVDIGANVGDFARAVKELYPLAQVHCYEPDPGTFKKLTKATGYKFGLVSRIHCSQWAIAHRHGFEHFSAGLDILSHVCRGNHKSADELCQHLIEVRCVPLSFAVDEPVDILKCDTEGGEWPIFEHAPRETMEKIAYLTMEFHDCRGEEAKQALWDKLNETHEMVSLPGVIPSGGPNAIWVGERR